MSAGRPIMLVDERKSFIFFDAELVIKSSIVASRKIAGQQEKLHIFVSRFFLRLFMELESRISVLGEKETSELEPFRTRKSNYNQNLLQISEPMRFHVRLEFCFGPFPFLASQRMYFNTSIKEIWIMVNYIHQNFWVGRMAASFQYMWINWCILHCTNASIALVRKVHRMSSVITRCSKHFAKPTAALYWGKH